MKNSIIQKNIHGSLLCMFIMLFVELLLTACGDDDAAGGTIEDENTVAIVDKTIKGVSQKGPFVNGSSVQLYELDGKTFSSTGKTLPGKISSDKGEFKISGINLESQYAFLEASGYYRNEVTGEKSTAPITLDAISDLSERETVNINLLTHLEYERVMKLIEEGISVAEAKKQAENEILAVFGIEGNFGNSEDMNIFKNGEADAALLAISIMLQGDRSEADLSEILANVAQTIAEKGKWDDGTEMTKIADWTSTADYAQIRNNVEGWNLGEEVPAFEKYLKNFWRQNFGLENCSKDNLLEIKPNTNEMSAYYNVPYICDADGWRRATDLEMDTYGWKEGKDGDVKQGDVVKNNCYVFEGKAWRLGNASDCSLELRGCTQLRQDTIGFGSDNVWHICDAKSWRRATTYEKDTFGWADSTDGTVKEGNVTGSIYIYKDEWVMDSVMDLRDRQKYKVVKIKNQTWMAQNLNYETDVGSWCYQNMESNCEKFGRLYDWDHAMTSCPEGFHLPSNGEWEKILTYPAEFEVDSVYGYERSKFVTSPIMNSGTNETGFGAVLSGVRIGPSGYNSGAYFNLGDAANYWSSTEISATMAYHWYVTSSKAGLYTADQDYYKDYGFSVRCIENY